MKNTKKERERDCERRKRERDEKHNNEKRERELEIVITAKPRFHLFTLVGVMLPDYQTRPVHALLSFFTSCAIDSTNKGLNRT